MKRRSTIELPVDIVEAAEQRPAPSRFPLSFVLSIGAHLALAVALLVTWKPQPFGGGTMLETISISLVDARDIAPPQIARLSLPPPPLAPSLNEDLMPPATEAKVSAQPRREDGAEKIEQDVASRDPDRLERLLVEARKDVPSLPPSAAQESVSASGGQPDSSTSPLATSSPSPDAAADAGASAAELRRYARDVAIALGKSRPKGVGQRGRVEIEFTIAPDGSRIERADVARSSGQHRLDALAKETVLRASFPRAPASFSVAQRTFRVPFNFD